MAKKAPKDLLNESQPTEIIEFLYDGTNYREELKSFQLEAITPLEVRNALNMAPAKFAYWSSKQADVELDIQRAKTEYDLWYAKKYTHVVDKKEEKGAKSRYIAEGSKKNEVLILNAEEYTKKIAFIQQLEHVQGKIAAIVKSFEMQSRTLQTIAALLRAEMGTYGKEE